MFRGSLGQYFTNLGAPLPWRRKLYLLARNSWIRISRAQTCCGHPGEPGC